MSNLFQPMPGKSTSISATATTASASVDATAPQVRLYNAGSQKCHVRWGIGAQTAVTTDMVLAAGAIETFHKGAADTIAAICATGETATLYITPGVGE